MPWLQRNPFSPASRAGLLARMEQDGCRTFSDKVRWVEEHMPNIDDAASFVGALVRGEQVQNPVRQPQFGLQEGRKPLLTVDGKQISYTVRLSYDKSYGYDGVQLNAYVGSKKIGTAEIWALREASLCQDAIDQLLAKFPQIQRVARMKHAAVVEQWMRRGVGTALYLAAMTEWFDTDHSPFILVADRCVQSGHTSIHATRMWEKLERSFPTSARGVIAVITRPVRVKNPPDSGYSNLLGEGAFSKAYAKPDQHESFYEFDGDAGTVQVDRGPRAIETITSKQVDAGYEGWGDPEGVDASKVVTLLARDRLKADKKALAYLPDLAFVRVDRRGAAPELVFAMPAYKALEDLHGEAVPRLTRDLGRCVDVWQTGQGTLAESAQKFLDCVRRKGDPALDREAPHVAKALRALHEVATSLPLTKYRADMHGGNVAVDAQGHLILLDPMVAEMNFEEAAKLLTSRAKKNPSLASELSPNQQSKYLGDLKGAAREARAAEILYRREHRSDAPFATDAGQQTKRSSHAAKFAKTYGRAPSDTADAAKLSGVSKKILDQVYARGMAAWQTGHRPGASQHAWAMARVESFLTGGPTMRGPDADLARKAGL